MSSNKLVYFESFNKIEWLDTDVTTVGSHERAERAILEVILAGRFLPIQAAFVIGEPLCDIGTPSRALIFF